METNVQVQKLPGAGPDGCSKRYIVGRIGSGRVASPREIVLGKGEKGKGWG